MKYSETIDGKFYKYYVNSSTCVIFLSNKSAREQHCISTAGTYMRANIQIGAGANIQIGAGSYKIVPADEEERLWLLSCIKENMTVPRVKLDRINNDYPIF